MEDPELRSMVDAIGPTPLAAIGRAVALTRDDLATYRDELPALGAAHSQRGMLHWVNNQFFAHVRAALEVGDSDHVVDRPAHHESFAGDGFSLRFVDHAEADTVAAYPTENGAEPRLGPGLHLGGGFAWDPEARTIGAPVISARDHGNNVQWVLELADHQNGADVELRHPDPTSTRFPEFVTPVIFDA